MRKLLDRLCAVALFIIAGIFGLCLWQAIIMPAISAGYVTSQRRETMIEATSLLEYLYEYVEKSTDKEFPESLSKLNDEELKKRGISDGAKLQDKYWYLPCPVNGYRDENTPILIEKTNHYSHSRSQTGVVAYILKDGETRWVFYKVGEGYLDLIAKYCSDLTRTNTFNKQRGRGADQTE